MLGFEISYQCLCLGDVVTLTCCELKAQRVAQSIHAHVDLGTEQCLCLGDVVTLTCCELKAQRVAQSIHAHVDLGTEPASAPAKSLGRFFLEAPAAQG